MEDETHMEEDYAFYSDTSLDHGDELWDLQVIVVQDGCTLEEVDDINSSHSMQHQLNELPNSSQASSAPYGSTMSSYIHVGSYTGVRAIILHKYSAYI